MQFLQSLPCESTILWGYLQHRWLPSRQKSHHEWQRMSCITSISYLLCRKLHTKISLLPPILAAHKTVEQAIVSLATCPLESCEFCELSGSLQPPSSLCENMYQFWENNYTPPSETTKLCTQLSVNFCCNTSKKNNNEIEINQTPLVFT